jgi:uncharacterized protein (UPF0261 family)
MKPIITILLLGSLAASPALAQTGTVGPKTIPGETREQKLYNIKQALTKMDVNGDKKITVAEWTDAGGKREGFDKLDTNMDGILTVQELRSNSRKLRAFEDFEAAPAF